MSFELWIMFHDGMPMIHKGCIYCHSTKYTTNDTTANVNKHKRMCTDVVGKIVVIFYVLQLSIIQIFMHN